MKKSLINVIILTLVLINLVLTVLLTFPLVSTSKKTNDFISKIAGIIDLDVGDVATDTTETTSGIVGISDLETINVTASDGSTKITISIMDDTKKVHQSVVSVAISLNKKSKDWDKLNTTVTDSGMSFIVSEINKVVSSYSFNNVLASKADMEKQILANLQEKFQSDIIYSVAFTGFVVQ